MLPPEPLPAGGLTVRPRCAPCRPRFSARCVPRHGWEQVDKLVRGVRVSNRLLRTFVIARCCRGCGSTGRCRASGTAGKHTLFRPLERVGRGEFLAGPSWDRAGHTPPASPGPRGHAPGTVTRRKASLITPALLPPPPPAWSRGRPGIGTRRSCRRATCEHTCRRRKSFADRRGRRSTKRCAQSN